MRQGDAVWSSLFAAGVAYEISVLRSKRDDDTLTRAVRRWMHTSHPVGKAAFAVGWAGFSVWWVRHIVNGGLA